MSKIFSCLLLSILVLVVFPKQAYAIENPLAVPNNKVGIHILFDSELPQAAQLVNSSGGDWGYVTIPIQAGDKDIEKWQKFMDNAKKFHLIPILRLATEGDYFNTTAWRKPTLADVIDFSNFLNSLNWPVKNRYIIVFNEVNRGDEWGGAASPQEYAQLLSYAVSVFKSKSPDYFLLNSGLDNAAPRQGTTYMNEYDYLRQMDEAVPGIFNQIDGFNSHSYPNPGFMQSPSTTSLMGVGSFYYEKQLVKSLSNKDLPVFITETGWTGETVSDDRRAEYYKTTFDTVWNEGSIVAVTPFLLQANGGPFDKFSFIGPGGNQTLQYIMLHNLPKTKGMPVFQPRLPRVLAASTENDNLLPKKDFSHQQTHKKPIPLSVAFYEAFKWIMKL